MKILLVEDDEGAALVLKNILTHQHYTVDLAFDGETGLSLAQTFLYDLVLLDIMLPKLDGLMFCRQLRAQKNDTSVLLLTALDSSTSKVIGLDAGADDYVIKPFDTNELLARIRALMRRKTPTCSSTIQAGNVRLDTSSSKVICNGKLLHLTAKEYALLELFLRNSNRIFTQEMLLDYLWSSEEMPLVNTVRAHIKALRRKLKLAGANDLIETVHRFGYRLNSKLDQMNFTTAANTNLPTEIDTTIVNQYKPQYKSQFSSVLADIWKRFKPRYSEQITSLEQSITALLVGTQTEEVAQQAIAQAHMLIGSLASFGFTEASCLSREIEKIFRDGIQQSIAQLERLSQLVVALRQELERANVLDPPITVAKRCQRQRFANMKQPRLLIMDNDALFCQQLIEEAALCGIEAFVAPLIDAKDVIAQNTPDVVLVDLHFSNSVESSLELLAELTSNNLALPVLVFTEVEDFTYRLKVARLGVQFFLHKPVAPSLVMAAVIQVLQRADVTGAKIMVVDNDSQVLDNLHTLLSIWGFELTLLDNPQRFWQTLNAFHPNLLILDTEMSLSSINGIDLCQVVRNDPYWNHLPVLFLSSRKDAQTVNQVFMAGADDYLSKPIVEPELITRILNRLERLRLQ
ncbi:multi-component transcriptional regulator, winged helix family [Calothrix sp. PCC 7716]|nr:multi-component transcriptional regulator, winged helix family [Calothrix sp. PCC 7716]